MKKKKKIGVTNAALVMGMSVERMDGIGLVKKFSPV